MEAVDWLDSQCKLKEIQRCFFLTGVMKKAHLHLIHMDKQKALSVKSTYFKQPFYTLDSLLNRNQCLVKTEALPISLGIKHKVNNATAAWVPNKHCEV